MLIWSNPLANHLGWIFTFHEQWGKHYFFYTSNSTIFILVIYLTNKQLWEKKSYKNDLFLFQYIFYSTLILLQILMKRIYLHIFILNKICFISPSVYWNWKKKKKKSPQNPARCFGSYTISMFFLDELINC